MRLREATLHSLSIPFRESFVHGTKERATSDALIVRIVTEDGVVGHGEGLARPYVTGETASSVRQRIRDVLWPALRGTEVPDVVPMELIDVVGDLLGHSEPTPEEQRGGVIAHHAARCAVELAVLDAALRTVGRSLGDALPPRVSTVRYGGVIGLVSLDTSVRLARRVRALGLGDCKIKVGDEGSLVRVRAVRETLGPDVALRVDANGVWGLKEAIDEIGAMTEWGIEGVEEPLARERRHELPELIERIDVPVILDESLVTAEDARDAARFGGSVVPDLRLSKCGGVGPSLALARIARDAGQDFIIGCQVGETAILSAAGRHLAAHLADPLRVEGSYGTLLLTEDLVEHDIRFGSGGHAPLLDGPGLGVEVVEERLDRYTVDREVLR